MFKKTPLSLAVVALLVLPVAAMAEIEVSGYVKNETAFHIQDGQRTGQATTTLDTASDDVGDVMKFENSARFFVNGDIGEESSFHADINLIHDSKGVNSDYKGHRNYTQNDWLREIYLDTTAADWDLRIGKQQEVWGTADGIKLLDIINPTDFREMNQNTMEDARIPVFMIKGERDIGDNGNIQLIISQVEENKIAGLNSDGDAGHPFIMKGVDTLTGNVNGFRNIGNTLPIVAGSFNGLAVAFSAPSLAPFATGTVNGFATNTGTAAAFGGACPGYGVGAGTASSACLDAIAQSTNSRVTNLIDQQDATVVTGAAPEWNLTTPNSTFEYLPNATFATFNTFSGDAAQSGTKANASTEWVRDYPDDLSANTGFRFRNSTAGGLNYSANYFYHYDSNPNVGVSWHDASDGTQLETELRNPDANGEPYGTVVSRSAVPTSVNAGGTNSVSVLLKRPGTTTYYGAGVPDPSTGSTTLSANAVKMRFTESLNRVHSIGTSFDYAFDNETLPVVVRGELLYDKDSTQIVMDRKLMGIGDFEGAFTTQEADYFKYVLGVDVTVMTNLMVSGQFIQFRNLDYVDQSRGGCTTQSGVDFNCDRYTADMAVMSLDNGFQRAKENKEFYSLFFSKPFGESQLGRWNNITIYEEGGGWWNRFDVEYSFSDQLVGTAELNTYWGDENTTFGQFEESSNIQVGVKYLFD
ncbi:MAG: RNA polymerase-associated protein rapA [Sedimenticola sp.]